MGVLVVGKHNLGENWLTFTNPNLTHHTCKNCKPKPSFGETWLGVSYFAEWYQKSGKREPNVI